MKEYMSKLENFEIIQEINKNHLRYKKTKFITAQE